MSDLFQEIWESIRRNKMRTCLTGFAVSWGIFIIIVLLGAGNGLMNSFLQDAGDVATNTMMVGGSRTSKPYGGYKEGRYIQLKRSDLDLLEERFPHIIDQLTTTISRSGYTLTYGKKSLTNVSLCGTFPSHSEMNRVQMLEGRFVNQNDLRLRRKVVVLTHLFARNLLKGGTDYGSLIGKSVRVGNLSFKIVGIRHCDENRNDRDLYVPYSTMKSLFGIGDNIEEITFSFHGLATEEENEAFEKEIKVALNSVHQAAPDDESSIWIWNRFTQNLQMEKGTGILRKALWIIGIFTLLGGVVGVSNIMLITVKERTHEFGIRKAIGAKPRNILSLIMAESVMITAFFGYVGMILGMLACQVMDKTLGQSSVEVFGQSVRMLVNPTVGMDVAVEATILLIVAGTIAGIFPAANAAKVRPIEALREE
ncbi:MAG: ABC transporter permease [Bacteroidaceae bacterium]|nr:ABC transporter permease [Bacteroidaceae bacterium]